jgi:hypothetical protein
MWCDVGREEYVEYESWYCGGLHRFRDVNEQVYSQWEIQGVLLLADESLQEDWDYGVGKEGMVEVHR